MIESPTTLNNVRNLETKYGFGKPLSSSEVADFKAAMREAGVDDAAACVVSAWLGGAPPGSMWSFFDKRESAEDACGRDFLSVPDVDDALEALRARSPALAQLVEVKAGKKQRSEYKSLAANADQDAKQLAKDAAGQIKEVLKDVAETTGDVISAALPWKLVIALVVVLIVVGSVWVYIRTGGD